MSHRRLIALCASATLLAGCGSGAGGGAATTGPTGAGNPFTKEVSGTLNISGFNPSDEVGKSRSDYAAEGLSGVTINQDTTNFDTQKFAAQAAAGQVPDLIQLNRSDVATFAQKRLIQPMDQCYTTWDVDPAEHWYEAAVDDVTYSDAVYAAPQFFQANALLANKRVLSAKGVTLDQLDTSSLDQLAEWAGQLSTQEGGNPTVIGFDPDLPGSAATWMTLHGAGVMDADGRPTLDDPANAEVLTWMKEVMDAQGGYAKVKSFKDSMDVFGKENQYVLDQVAIQTWAQWYPNVLAPTKDAVSIAAAPLKDSDGQVVGMAGGTAFAIPAASKNPSAACAWAVRATSTEAWLKAGEARAQKVESSGSIATGLMTASPEADQAIREQFVKPSGNADFDQVVEAYYSALENTRSVGASPVGQTITSELNNAVVTTLAGEKQPQQALADAQAAAMRAWDQVD